METVIDVLKAMGKATYREVAARLEIEPVEALNMLREQREQGLCDFFDGGWMVTDGQSVKPVLQRPSAKPVTAGKPELRGEAPEPVQPEVVTTLLRENGAMDTVTLAAAVGRNARGMTSAMRSLERGGLVIKIGQGKGVKWGLPDRQLVSPEPGFAELPEIEITPKAAAPAPAPSAEPEPVTIRTEEFLETIPVMRKPSQSLQVPSLREISKQIRKTKSNLNSLERLHAAVREVGRNRHALRFFNGEGE
ncbi:DUF1627 domain-containing protein [Citrobacter koseri]|uniref:DUF1627 domain-containing protein n=1 Tax=Citrobacter koseri TaxID=545 RepID=UPI003FD4708F